MTDQDDTHKMDKATRERLDRYLALSAATLLAVGTVVYHLIEDWSWVDSFYFSVIAVTTVGFGDISPGHGWSKAIHGLLRHQRNHHHRHMAQRADAKTRAASPAPAPRR